MAEGNSCPQSWQKPRSVPDAPPATIQSRDGGAGCVSRANTGGAVCASTGAGMSPASTMQSAKRFIGFPTSGTRVIADSDTS
jgi:hypothetical protein